MMPLCYCSRWAERPGGARSFAVRGERKGPHNPNPTGLERAGAGLCEAERATPPRSARAGKNVFSVFSDTRQRTGFF